MWNPLPWTPSKCNQQDEVLMYKIVELDACNSIVWQVWDENLNVLWIREGLYFSPEKPPQRYTMHSTSTRSSLNPWGGLWGPAGVLRLRHYYKLQFPPSGQPPGILTHQAFPATPCTRTHARFILETCSKRTLSCRSQLPNLRWSILVNGTLEFPPLHQRSNRVSP